MLCCVSKCKAYASFFTVVKKVEEDGRIILRLITDLRKVNAALRPPPWVPLSGPRALCGLDVGGLYEEGWRIAAAGGVAPDFYYTLRIPTWLSEFLIVEGGSPFELRQRLISEGFQKGLKFCF